MTVANGDRG